MSTLSNDVKRIHNLVTDACQTVGKLLAISDGAPMSPQKMQQTLEQVSAFIEKAALEIRKLCELHIPENFTFGQKSFADVVKTTGEIKDTFKFTYKGRRYDRLSLSEKIRAGMEVSELMKRLTGRNYPVFVDNMESVDDLANVRPTGQLLMAKCVRNTELSVRPMEQRAMPKAA